MTNGHLNTQSLRQYWEAISDLYNLCGQVSVHEGDVTFWANSVRNNAKSLADSLKYLERELDKRELAEREQAERELAERTESIVKEVA